MRAFTGFGTFFHNRDFAVSAGTGARQNGSSFQNLSSYRCKRQRGALGLVRAAMRTILAMLSVATKTPNRS
jgi:hypothetical protein